MCTPLDRATAHYRPLNDHEDAHSGQYREEASAEENASLGTGLEAKPSTPPLLPGAQHSCQDGLYGR